MAVLSGKSGTLKLAGAVVTPISNWKLELTSDNKAYAANDTAGARKRVAGLKDSAGTLECKVSDTGHCPVERGEQVTAQFHVDGTANNYYEVPIIIDKISVDCDIQDGGIVAFVVAFSGDGAVTGHGILATSSGGV
jgi:hypothetical protein